MRVISFSGIFDTSGATDMNHILSRCNDLMELDVNGFDTSKVTNMKGTAKIDRNLSLFLRTAINDDSVQDHRVAVCSPVVFWRGTGKYN